MYPRSCRGYHELWGRSSALARPSWMVKISTGVAWLLRSCEWVAHGIEPRACSQRARVRSSPMCTRCAHRAQKVFLRCATIQPWNVHGEGTWTLPRRCANHPRMQKRPGLHARTYFQHPHLLPPRARQLHVAQPVSCPITYPCSCKRAHDGLPPFILAFRTYEQPPIRCRPWMTLVPEACRLGCTRLLGTRSVALVSARRLHVFEIAWLNCGKRLLAQP